MNRLQEAADRLAYLERKQGRECVYTVDALMIAASMFDAVMERADDQARQIAALEKAVKPAPEPETVTISKELAGEVVEALCVYSEFIELRVRFMRASGYNV
jgi:hypothetical protein